MQMGSADPPGKTDEKLKKRKYAKKSSFLNMLTAIRAGRCIENGAMLTTYLVRYTCTSECTIS